jgi:outer membrane immunogenic protein
MTCVARRQQTPAAASRRLAPRFRRGGEEMTITRAIQRLLLASSSLALAIAAQPAAGNATEVSATALAKIMSRLDRLESENNALKKEVASLRDSKVRDPAPGLTASPAPGAATSVAPGLATRQASKRALASTPTSAGPSPAALPAIQPTSVSSNEYAQAPRFSGIYVGINGGYGRGMVSTFGPSYSGYGPFQLGYDTFPGYAFYSNGSGNFFAEGPFVGGQIGYNYQFANNIMLGAETDLDWADVLDPVGYNQAWGNGAGFSGLPSTASYNANSNYNRVGMDWIGTARVRLGYAFGPFIPYLTAGLAYGQLSSSTSSFFMGAFTPGTENFASLNHGNTTAVTAGWAVGAGAEYMLVGPWSIKGEYLYTSIGGIMRSDNLTTITYLQENGFSVIQPAIGGAQISTGSFGIHQVRVGLNYHLDFGRDIPTSLMP